MIYKKNANFPYPVLQNFSNCYGECEFNLDILEVKEDKLNYEFIYRVSIGSKFILDLLRENRAELYLIINSSDSKFIKLKIDSNSEKVSKNRLFLNKKIDFQLMIKANEEIEFSNNNDITGLYKELRDEIIVNKNSILGFSNIITLEEYKKDGVELFKKRVDNELESEIEFELTDEHIIIVYKNEELQFNDIMNSIELNNLYIYAGLQKALYNFINNNKRKAEEDEVDIDDMEVPSIELELKLYKLMKKNMIKTLNFDNVDKVIYCITDNIVGKFMNKVRENINDGD